LPACRDEPDFAVRVNHRARTLHRNDPIAEYRLSVQASNGFDALVMLHLDGLPEGISASVSGDRVEGSGSVLLRLARNGPAAPGAYVVTVTGTANGAARSTDLVLIVE